MMDESMVTIMADGDVTNRVHDKVCCGFDPGRAHLFDADGLALPSLKQHPLVDRAAADA